MQILSASEMKAADAATFNDHGVCSLAVMESAGRAIGSYLVSEYAELLDETVLIICGAGNNGGDGFVLARMLFGMGVPVEVLCLASLESLKGDAAVNARSFVSLGGAVAVLEEDSWEQILGQSLLGGPRVLVDAIYGTGFRAPMRGVPRGVTGVLNTYAEQNPCLMLSIDIPSGIVADSSEVEGDALCADVTIALQSLKHGHVHYPATSYCGEVLVADIGVQVNEVLLQDAPSTLVDEEFVSDLLFAASISNPQAHKGSRGHVYVVGGSSGKYGAPKLSADAALTLGAGKVTMVLPHTAAERVAVAQSELMCESLADIEGDFGVSAASDVQGVIAGADALLVGPGMGLKPGSVDVLRSLLQLDDGVDNRPLVLDADALTILSENEDLWSFISERVVLTPHPGEMARLLSIPVSEVQSNRRAAALQLSSERSCWVLLKGARSILSGPDASQYVIPAAISTLGTAGSGDALAGMIAAFLAQGFSPRDASVIAAFSHGAAGELSFNSCAGPLGTRADDLPAFAARVCNELLHLPRTAPRLLRKVLPGSIHDLPLELFDRQ